MVKYSYDAYGKCTVDSDSTTSKIGTLNPFRFKGYYLDTETGFYYCNSRYYVPDWGRWLTADSIQYLDPTSVYGMNLYAYCYNNPINYYDQNGHIAISTILTSMLIGFVVGAAFGAGAEAVKQFKVYKWNIKAWDWGQIGLSALGGALAGAISGIPTESLILTFIFGGAGSVVGGLINGSVNSWDTGFLAFAVGGFANVVGKCVGDYLKELKVFKQVNRITSKAQQIANMSSKKKSLAICGLMKLGRGSRNAFKDWGYDQIFSLLFNDASNLSAINSIENLARFTVYSSISSNICSELF